jgi:Kef-type K+ transport system membrane component KefB/voltage-gated potassium channel Kch
MTEPFIQFGVIILIVVLVSLIMRLLKQPLIVGYILSGILVGPLFLDLIQEGKTFFTFSQMGIAFLLFIVGLHLSPKVLKQVGGISLVNGFGQIVFTVGLGYFIALALGFDKIVSLYLAIAITFSSTIIVMKLLSDKDDMDKLYGKISMGLALVQNLVAIVILIIISSLSMSGGFGSSLFFTLIKGILLICFLIPLGYFILPKLNNFLAKSTEFLFLFSIAWGFGLSIVFLYIGFSIEVGALIAGIMLSMSPYSFEISSKLKPLRDFFILSFFIILGSQMVFTDFSRMIFPAIILSLFILIGNPFAIMVLMGMMGYSKKTGFMAGLTVAQISEFSLILIALVVRTGQLPQEILSFITVIALITMAGSTYMIIYSEVLYEKFKKILSLFEKKTIKEKEIVSRNYDYILLGYNRIGFSIVKSFSKITKKFLIVDYDPKIVRDMKKRGFNAIYGDVDDSDFLEEIGISKASMVVSTIPEKEVNELILQVLKRNKSDTLTLLTARQINDALDLYKSGASYVILPHFLGGEYTARLIQSAKNKKELYNKEKLRELKSLHERLRQGQEHPEIMKERK